MKVVPFPNPSLNDIPAMLRILADDIEAGNYGFTAGAAMVLETEDSVINFGWGVADGLRAIGLLTAGAAMLTSTMWED